MAVEDFFDYLVPGAAAHRIQFLSTVAKRTNELGIGLHVVAVEDRKSGRVTVEGGLPGVDGYGMQVFADEYGTMLHVGWMIQSPSQKSSMAMTGFGQFVNASTNESLAKQRENPHTVRVMSLYSKAQHRLAFAPTLQELTSAVETTVPGNGFLGIP